MSIRRLLAPIAAVVLALVAGAGTAAAEAGTSNGATYAVVSTSIDAGSGWKLDVGQLSGGDAKVAAAFNAASTASGHTMIGMLDRDQVLRDDATFDGKPTVSFRPSTVSQVLVGVYFHRNAAHPLDYVSTVVIDSRTATPIALRDLFGDEQAGLNRLSEETKLLLPRVYGRDGGPMSDERGNAPTEQNFHNWIPTADGLEIHFEDYQFAHGLPIVTVPWAKVTDVLAPNMRVLAR